MSIHNKDAPADGPAQPTIDRDSKAGLSPLVHYRSAPEKCQYDDDHLSRRPLPPPSSSQAAIPPQYTVSGVTSQTPVATSLPGIHAFSTEAYKADGAHSEERSNHRSERLSGAPVVSHSQRVAQHAPGSAPSSRRTGFSRIERSHLDELRTGPSAPPPMLTGLPSHSSDDRTYKLIIRQQPQQGRLCGLGSKDKRPLDPLPILQLRILNKDGSEDEDAENSPNLILQVTLRRVDPSTGTHTEAVLVESNDPAYRWTRMLEGRIVASANVARDLDGSRACFFVFTDLSIRQEGQFRLAFKLIALGPPNFPSMGASGSTGGQVLAEALTEPFSIYSPRRFPGMTESTELAKCLARQGIQVPVRNDIRRKQEQDDSQAASPGDKDNFD